MFLKRLLTACIGIPVAIYLINHGGLIYASSITVIAALAWHEYCKMMACKQIAIPVGFGLISLLFILSCAWFGNSNELLAVIFLTYIVILGLTVVRSTIYSINSAAYTILGITYIALPFAYLLLLRLTDSSLFLPS